MSDRVLEILIKATNVATPGIKSARNAIEKFSKISRASMDKLKMTAKAAAKSFKENWLAAAAAIFALNRAIKITFNTINKFGVEAASIVENLRIRLNAALRSVEEGNILFKNMERLASRVSFEYKQIIDAATTLASVMKGGRQEVEQFMPIILDLAAFSGLTVEETTSQIIKMYSAGAAAADMFRERGVLAMLGFKAKVSVSAEETRERLIEAWEASDSKFRDLSKKLGNTWTGLLSMLSDRLFVFKKNIGEAGFFDRIKREALTLLTVIDKMTQTGELERAAERISVAFENIITTSKLFILTTGRLIGGIGLMVNAVFLAIGKAAEGLLTLMNTTKGMIPFFAELSLIFKGLNVDTEKLEDLAKGFGDESIKAINDISENLIFMEDLLNPKLLAALEEVQQGFSDMGDEAKDAAKKAIEQLKITEKVVKGTVQRLAGFFSDILFDSITSGFFNAKQAAISFGRSMLRMLTDMIAKVLILKALGFFLPAGATAIAGVPLGQLFHTGGKIKYHSGGLIKAHEGMLARDERVIVAQTGERVLSRQQNSQYERMMGGGVSPSGGGGQIHNYYIQATDPRSFEQLIRANPGVISGIIQEGITKNTNLRKTMQRFVA